MNTSRRSFLSILGLTTVSAPLLVRAAVASAAPQTGVLTVSGGLGLGRSSCCYAGTVEWVIPPLEELLGRERYTDLTDLRRELDARDAGRVLHS